MAADRGMDCRVKRVTLVTSMPFWGRAHGSATRTYELCRYLGRHVDLSVVYLGESVSESDLADIHRVSRSFDWVRVGAGITPQDLFRATERTLSALHPDACIVDRLTNAWVVSALAKPVQRIVDTHDLMSLHLESARKLGIEASLARPFMRLTIEEEFRLLAKFDVAIFIQQHEHDLARPALGEERCVVAPHPAIPAKRELRTTVHHVGLAASAWPTNVDGIGWFAEEIWPKVRRPGVTFDVYGAVCESLQSVRTEQCTLHGFVDDVSRIYDRLDIVVNPVRAGSGLKIKSIEALGCGLPLVTTPEGAKGLESFAGRGFLVAESAQQFVDHLDLLMTDREYRVQLGADAFELASNHLSPDRCFSRLLEAIEDGVRAGGTVRTPQLADR
jgi:hypothetical protein